VHNEGVDFAFIDNIGDNYAVFEPTRCSEPKYDGQYKVNPRVMLFSTKLMFTWLGVIKLANMLKNAIAKVIGKGNVRTFDMGGNLTTLEVAEEVVLKF